MKTQRSARAGALAWLIALAIGTTALSALAAESQLTGVVNLNTATQEELQLLPGIGESRAKAVIEARKRKGGFQKVEDLLEVKGIGEAGLQKLRPHVTLEGKTTAHTN
ncbi:MAG TPA: helix-hairpin-helix domain-containing protein [Myxococcota bacterium]|nr:helix-hairpin-helix domain-containing protein [Myxococcota bacterium]